MYWLSPVQWVKIVLFKTIPNNSFQYMVLKPFLYLKIHFSCFFSLKSICSDQTYLKTCLVWPQNPPENSLTGPYLALLGLTGPYWALLGLIWALLGLIGPSLGLTWPYLGLTAPYLGPAASNLTSLGLIWALLGLTGRHLASLGLTVPYWALFGP